MEVGNVYLFHWIELYWKRVEDERLTKVSITWVRQYAIFRSSRIILTGWWFNLYSLMAIHPVRTIYAGWIHTGEISNLWQQIQTFILVKTQHLICEAMNRRNVLQHINI